MKSKSKFGKTVRNLRENREIGLRQFAKRVGMSPTYLSKVERGDFPPPSETKIRAIARELGQDEDALLSQAGRVSSDLGDIIRQNPVEMAVLIRTLKGLPRKHLYALTRHAVSLHYSSQGINRSV